MRNHLQALDNGEPVPKEIEQLVSETRKRLNTPHYELGRSAVKATKEDIGF